VVCLDLGGAPCQYCGMDQAQRRVVVAASIGTFVESYDLALYGYLAVILAGQFFPAGDPDAALLATFAVFALGFAVRPLGGIVFGHAGDRLGRRPAIAASVLLAAAATASIAVLPTYQQAGLAASALLLTCRLLQGFSAGGEIAGANIFVLEHAATGRAGRSVSVNIAASSLGFGVAAAVGWLMTVVMDASQLASWGWRVPFAVAAPLGLIGLYLRWRVAESPAFHTAERPRFPLGRTLRTAWRGVLIFVGFFAMVLVGSNLLVGYLPSYLARTAGLSATEVSVANILLAVLLGAGAVLGGRLIDRFSLRGVAVACAAGLIVVAVPGFVIMRRGTLAAAVTGGTMWAVVIGVGTVLGATLALRLFAAPVRFTAAAFAINITSVVFAGTGPYLSAWLVSSTGNVTAPALYLSVLAAGGLAVALFAIPRGAGERTRLPSAVGHAGAAEAGLPRA
jgi:MHS family proline/betaine transporter-like MFS transporter